MKFAALAGLLAVAAGALVLVFQPFQSSPPGSSASRTIYSFVYALDHNNYGRACSYMADDIRGPEGVCSNALLSNAAFNLALFGDNIFDGMKVVPGSAHENPDGSVSYRIESRDIPPTRVKVARQKSSGLWRVVAIG